MSASLRQIMIRLRDRVPEHLRREWSEAAAFNLEELPQFRDASLPMLYASVRSELETFAIIKRRLKAGKRVALPVTDPEKKRLLPYEIQDLSELRSGAYGILEPDPEKARRVHSKDLDVVVVPGTVFDQHCGRYGYGGGYYDRFLAGGARSALRIGLAFEIQVLPRIRLAKHDQKMDLLVTEERIIACRSRRLARWWFRPS